MNINGQSLEQTSDPSITANIHSQVGQTNQGIANSYDSGASEARGLLTSGGNSFNSGLGYSDKATSDAIRARYMPQANLKAQELSLENLKNAQSDHLRNLQVATQAAGEEVQLNKQKALLKWQVEQQNKKARGAVLGTTLGIVGGVVGAVYGGGAPGAMAGYSAGSGVGNAIGSS